MNSLQLQKPHMVIVVGLHGAGKSFFAEKFAETFSAPFLDYGQLRRTIGDIDTANGIASNMLAQLFRTKQTVVIEGIGSSKAERSDIAVSAKRHGYDVLYVWVQTEPLTARKRALLSKEAPITEHEFDRSMAEFEILRQPEPVIVISGKHTHATQTMMVLKKLVAGKPKPTTVVKPRRTTKSRTRKTR